MSAEGSGHRDVRRTSKRLNPHERGEVAVVAEEARPRLGSRFFRAHGLGNDYLVFEAGDEWTATPHAVRMLCQRWRGLGSDGIVALLEPEPEGQRPFPLRMFNPDGSEFERSGNGLRVLGAWLHRSGRVAEERFRVRSGGDDIGMRVHAVSDEGEYDISVRMGRANPSPEAVGLDPTLLTAHAAALPMQPVSVGNPHAVVFVQEMSPPLTLSDTHLRELGSLLSANTAFRQGTNVQLVRVERDGRLRIAIWERGVGKTYASGSSSCAAAVAAVHRGRIPPGTVVVEMEGGTMEVTVSAELDVILRGPVREVCEGRLTARFIRSLTGE
ncbi:MAG: diaminopimelate epimerase [Gemmatimonadales bacterium]|nr:MAG: diaminopimelate epimerase [Gemmatimonadales bacterium]